MKTGPGVHAFLRWCATEMTWLRYVESAQRRINVWILAGGLTTEHRRRVLGMGGGASASLVQDLATIWFRAGDIFLPLDTLCDGVQLAETFVHELQHVIDFSSGERGRMTREECEARACRAEETFWARVPRREAFRKFEVLAAAEIRSSLTALVRATPCQAHLDSLRRMHFAATVAGCLETCIRRGAPDGDALVEEIWAAVLVADACRAPRHAPFLAEKAVRRYVEAKVLGQQAPDSTDGMEVAAGLTRPRRSPPNAV